MKKVDLEIELHKDFWQKYHNYIFIESIEEYKEYLLKLTNGFIIAKSEIETIESFVGHQHSNLARLGSLFTGEMIEKKENRQPMLNTLDIIECKVIANQLKQLLVGNKLAINKNGGYFPITDKTNYKITEIPEENELNPNIEIKQWYGGKHFYAKVKGIDVVDEFGNVKWNTEEQAIFVAEKFLEQLKIK